MINGFSRSKHRKAVQNGFANLLVATLLLSILLTVFLFSYLFYLFRITIEAFFFTVLLLFG